MCLEKEGSGRPSLLSANDLKKIKNFIDLDLKISAPKISKQYCDFENN